MRRIAASVLLFSVLVPIVRAQSTATSVNAGFPENGFFHGSDVESVQMNNGNLHIQIPIWKTPGRGLDASAFYLYDSKEWMLFSRCPSTTDTCNYSVGAEPGAAYIPMLKRSTDYQVSSQSQQVSTGCASPQFAAQHSNVVLREPDGTKHHFSPDPLFPNLGYKLQRTSGAAQPYNLLCRRRLRLGSQNDQRRDHNRDQPIRNLSAWIVH